MKGYELTGNLINRAPKMQKGERYIRGGMSYGEPVGPVFEVERVSLTGEASLRATTTLTGYVLKTTNYDVPDGWIGPLDDQTVKYQEHRQEYRGGRRS